MEIKKFVQLETQYENDDEKFEINEHLTNTNTNTSINTNTNNKTNEQIKPTFIVVHLFTIFH
jgi:hypothetical protein